MKASIIVTCLVAVGAAAPLAHSEAAGISRRADTVREYFAQLQTRQDEGFIVCTESALFAAGLSQDDLDTLRETGETCADAVGEDTEALEACFDSGLKAAGIAKEKVGVLEDLLDDCSEFLGKREVKASLESRQLLGCVGGLAKSAQISNKELSELNMARDTCINALIIEEETLQECIDNQLAATGIADDKIKAFNSAIDECENAIF